MEASGLGIGKQMWATRARSRCREYVVSDDFEYMLLVKPPVSDHPWIATRLQ